MFTGLIETVGTIIESRGSAEGRVLGIRPDLKEFATPIGCSVAIDGACLTVETISGNQFFVTAVKETLHRSTLGALAPGKRVNLERALQLGGRLDGHLVTGHVDGRGVIISDHREGQSTLRTIEMPRELGMLAAEKGSIAIDGISLTIATMNGNRFSVALIPHTLDGTTMKLKGPRDEVNLECDIVARYISRLVNYNKPDESVLSRLEELGF